MTTLPKEMAAWAAAEPVEPVPAVDGGFWRGVIVGVPIGIAMWTAILLSWW